MKSNEQDRMKTKKLCLCLTKAQISLCISSVVSASSDQSLCCPHEEKFGSLARKFGSLARKFGSLARGPARP